MKKNYNLPKGRRLFHILQIGYFRLLISKFALGYYLVDTFLLLMQLLFCRLFCRKCMKYINK